MSRQSKFNALMTCLLENRQLLDFVTELFRTDLLYFIKPPVKVRLSIRDEHPMIRITDEITSFVLNPGDLDEQMLKTIQHVFQKYEPDEPDESDETEDEEQMLKTIQHVFQKYEPDESDGSDETEDEE